MRALRTATAAIGVTVLVGVTAGCESPGAGDRSRQAADSSYRKLARSLPEPPITVDRVPTSVSSVGLPLDAYTLSAGQNEALARAEQLLVTGCMRAKGFTYIATSRSAPAQHREGLGLLDKTQAANYGYHDPGLLNGTKKLAVAKPAYMTDSYLIALRGWSKLPPEGVITAPGCQDQAAHHIQVVDNGADPELVLQLAADVAQRTRADSRVREALADWSSCMLKKGLHYATPADAAAAPRTGVTQRPSPSEVSTAVSDVNCKTTVGLAAIWLAVEAAYQKAAVALNITALNNLRKDNETRLQRAESVLSAHR